MSRMHLLVAACFSLLSLAAPPAGFAAPEALFTISIDPAAWRKWGFQYPNTYVFQAEAIAGKAQASWRDAGTTEWNALGEKTADDFFNGAECFRADRPGRRLYVSLGLHGAPTLELRLIGAEGIRFVGPAKYYDDRKAAYTLSLDNWGCNAWAHPGAEWRGPTDDESDNYQAAVHVCRQFRLPVSIAINSRSAGDQRTWRNMQTELDRGDQFWEPAVHGQTHPKNREAYLVRGYRDEILGCRADILARLKNIPYGGRVYEHILTHGYVDDEIRQLDAGEFLFLRGFNWADNPRSTTFAQWDPQHRFYGVAGLNTKGYDSLLERREPKARFYAADVAGANASFDTTHHAGGIFYALWHPDRFQNSVIYDPRPGRDGVQGSTLMAHLAHIAGRKDVWYVANGWLYSYHFVAENVRVQKK